MPDLVCPVRDCGAVLAQHQRTLRCKAGHAFDVARSGYVNLLQPQDRRSREPGDSAEVTGARRRSLERGLGEALLDALVEMLARSGVRPPDELLDAGAGEGFFAGAIAARTGLGVWAVDLSRPAIDAAARRHPSLHLVIANADRRLPFPDGSFAAITSITGPKPGPELRRLLAPRGVLLVAVPAPDDQIELRRAVFGQVPEEPRGSRVREMFAPWFMLEHEQEVRSRHRLDREALHDLFASGYRGARRSQRQGLERIESTLEVTVAYSLLAFRPR